MFDSRYRSVIHEVFLPSLEDYHHFSILPRSRSDKHLVYSLASYFEMVFSPSFNVSMFIWSSHSSYLGVLLPPHIMLSFGSVWIMVLCSLSYSSV